MEIKLSLYSIFYAAKKMKKRSLFGLPDVISGLSQTETAELNYRAESELRRSGLLKASFVGEPIYDQSLLAIVDQCSNCSAYLTLNCRSPKGEKLHRVIWKKDGKYLSAIAVSDDEWLFSWIDSNDLTQETTPNNMQDLSYTGGTATIPVGDLMKAKRLLYRNETQKAHQLLNRTDMPEDLINAVLDVLSEVAEAYSEVLISRSGNETGLQAVSAHNHIFSLQPAVQNYRSLITFSDITKNVLFEKHCDLIQKFMNAGH